MALQKTFCVNHPDRPAIGVCVETKQPLCGECATRYNGVNYSREGLEILRRRRERERAGGWFWPRLVVHGAVLSALLFVCYYGFSLLLLHLLGPA